MKVDLSGHYGYGRLLKTMVPSVLTVVTASIYSIVDGLFVSNIAGATPFAAINLMWPVLMLVGALGMMVGAGGSALVAKILGEQQNDRANEVFTMLVKFCLYIGVILSLILFLLLPLVIRLLGAEGYLADCSYIYSAIMLIGFPAYILQVAFQSLYMTAEKPALGTWMTIICGLTNVVLDALFIMVFGWGITGAALASIAGMMIAGFFPLWYFSKQRKGCLLKLVKAKLELQPIRKACSNGLSEYVTNIAMSVVGICYNIQLMHYIGEAGVAAYGIIMYVAFIFAAIYIGYNICVTPIIGFNYGAKNYDELKSLLKKSLHIVFAIGIMMTVLSEIGADLAAKVFVGYNEELTSLTAHAFRLYMLCFLFYGFNQFVSAWFTALNNGVISAICSFVHTLVFEILCIFTLPLILGLDGVWLAIDVADVLTISVTLTFLFKYRNRYGY